ncbi:MAG: molybdenum cofactor guanylyltransferase [Pseudomonadota bacterium]
MRVLAAILAGGAARRFGSDKAHALYKGKRLIDCVASSLRAQSDDLVVCGREEPGFACLPDRPEAGLGPLGGLSAALHHGRAQGFTHVLSAGVDVPNLPQTIAQVLAGEGAAIVQSQPVVGLWPAALEPDLDAYLAEGQRALYGFGERVNARQIAFNPTLMNINEPSDLGEQQ